MIDQALVDGLEKTIGEISLALVNEPDEIAIDAIKQIRRQFKPLAVRLSFDGDALTQAVIEEVLQRRHELQIGCSAANRTIH